ncbi:MAG: hypothetical protein LBV33_06670, partial [Lachnospiraceae bacterium]|jgi:hypothetical protein|nr:hypothetical protein [Lachnospiraceae bacterium]
MAQLLCAEHLTGMSFATDAKVIYGNYMDTGIVIHKIPSQPSSVALPAEPSAESLAEPSVESPAEILAESIDANPPTAGSAPSGQRYKYYLLEADEGNNTPRVINQNDIIRHQDIHPDNAHRIASLNIIEMRLTIETAFPDVLHSPFFLVSSDFMKLINTYDEEIAGIHIKLWEKESYINKTYKLPIFQTVDCLSAHSRLSLDKTTIERLILDGDKLDDQAIFRLSGFTHGYIIARLDMVESMIRRKLKGIRYREVEVYQ